MYLGLYIRPTNVILVSYTPLLTNHWQLRVQHSYYAYSMPRFETHRFIHPNLLTLRGQAQKENSTRTAALLIRLAHSLFTTITCI